MFDSFVAMYVCARELTLDDRYDDDGERVLGGCCWFYKLVCGERIEAVRAVDFSDDMYNVLL